MLFVLVQPDGLGQVVEIAVHPDTDVAGAAGVLKDLGVFALSAPDDGGKDLDAGGGRQCQHLIDDLVYRLLADLLAALGAVGGAHSGPEEAEVVVNLRHRAHGGAGVFGGRLLIDGDGGRQSVNIVHVRLLHLPQKHPGIGGQALHIPPLALCVNGIKGQGGLAAAGQAGDDHQLVTGDGDVHVF